MEINIDQITTTVRAVDSDSVLDQKTMSQIVVAVLKALEDRDLHRSQIKEEQALEFIDRNYGRY